MKTPLFKSDMLPSIQSHSVEFQFLPLLETGSDFVIYSK